MAGDEVTRLRECRSAPRRSRTGIGAADVDDDPRIPGVGSSAFFRVHGGADSKVDFAGIDNSDFVEVDVTTSLLARVVVGGCDVSDEELTSGSKGLLSAVDKVCCARPIGTSCTGLLMTAGKVCWPRPIGTSCKGLLTIVGKVCWPRPIGTGCKGLLTTVGKVSWPRTTEVCCLAFVFSLLLVATEFLSSSVF